jgi:hypothetical protein
MSAHPGIGFHLSWSGAIRTVAAAAVLAVLLAAVWVFLRGEPAGAQSASFSTRVTTNNKVGLTTTNYGFYGNNFSSRAPSFEYPVGSGFEHLIRAGLWIGGTVITPTGDTTRVSTGTMDGSVSENALDRVEYVPVTVITERSTLTNNRFFNPDAVSEQDYVCTFTDDPGRSGARSLEDHLPLGVEVTQEIYNWSFAAFADLVIVHLTIKSTKSLIRDMFVGMTAEFASGPKNSYGTWPPSSSSGGSLGSWFSKKLITWDPARRLAGEHFCTDISSGIEGCQFEITPPWAGLKLLGIRPDTVATKQLGFHLWNWSPGDNSRSLDEQLYTLLSSPHQTDPDSLPPSARSNDPVELLTVGPFDLLVDSTVVVDFAFVAGEFFEDLENAADFAQLAFDFNYVVPTPPPSPRLHVVARENSADLFWDHSPEFVMDETSPQPGGLDFQGYRVHLGEESESDDLRRIAQFDIVDTTGFDTGLAAISLPDSVLIEGDWFHYKYTITGLKDGFKNFVAVTSYDTGDQQISSLESGITQNKAGVITSAAPGEVTERGVTVFPNPYKAEAMWDSGTLVRDHYLWFANLPRRCKLTIFTVAGDLVFETAFDGDTYTGANARGIFDPRREIQTGAPNMSGGMYGWNLISREGQAVSTGLYIYTVEDSETGDVQRGKFVIIKSDRESF